MPDGFEHSLLLSALALREKMIDRATLIEALRDWGQDGTRRLDEIIRARGGLTTAQLLQLEAKVAQQLHQPDEGTRALLTGFGLNDLISEHLATRESLGPGTGWRGVVTGDVDATQQIGSEASVAGDNQSSAPDSAPRAPSGLRYQILGLLDKGGLGEV